MVSTPPCGPPSAPARLIQWAAPVNGRRPSLGGYLLLVQCRRLRRIRRQRHGKFIPNTENPAQQAVLLPTHRTAKQCLPQTLARFPDLPFRPDDADLWSGACRSDTPSWVFPIRNQHGHQQVATRGQHVDLLGAGFRKRAHTRTGRLGEVSKDQSIQRVRLGQPAGWP